MQQVWIMIKSHLQQLNFLKGFKIKCIMLYHIKQLLKLYIIEQIQKKKIWALLLGKILETDVVIAKNYLSKEELESLELIVSAFLDLAENRAKRHIPMTMEDWSERIDKFLLADDLDILKDAGKISHEIACDKALSEFEKYRVKQDLLYNSDFDNFLNETKMIEKDSESNE